MCYERRKAIARELPFSSALIVNVHLVIRDVLCTMFGPQCTRCHSASSSSAVYTYLFSECFFIVCLFSCYDDDKWSSGCAIVVNEIGLRLMKYDNFKWVRHLSLVFFSTLNFKFNHLNIYIYIELIAGNFLSGMLVLGGNSIGLGRVFFCECEIYYNAQLWYPKHFKNNQIISEITPKTICASNTYAIAIIRSGHIQGRYQRKYDSLIKNFRIKIN